jgi:hypothetical protein
MQLVNPNIVDQQFLTKVNVIVKRLKYSVHDINIIEWLENFHTKDVDAMLALLENLEYVTEHELVEFINDRLTSIFELIGDNEILNILPIADFGKSGTLIIYYLKKTLIYRSKANQINILIKPIDLKNKTKGLPAGTNYNLALLDDFFGSGRSLTSFFKTYVGNQSSLEKLNVRYIGLCIFYLQKAKDRVRKLGMPIEIIGDLKMPCFERGSSFSGGGRIHLRELAYSYGEDLMVEADTGKVHPLGFNNSQGLIVFPYNPPNNTLSIIWSNRYSVKFQHRWIPLYPRTPEVKMDTAKRMRSKLAYEMSLLHHTELEMKFFTGRHDLPWKSISFIKNTDFKVFGYLRLKMLRKSDVSIGQIMGLSSSDIAEIQKDGIARDLFENGESGIALSENGREIYNALLESLASFKKQIKYLEKKDFKIKDVIYLPSKFRGQTRKLN